MRKILTVALLPLAACTGDSDNPVKRALAETPPPATGAAVVFRFPQRVAQEGSDHATLYRLPALEEVAWQFEVGPAPVREVVGFAGDEDLVYTITTDSTLVALDLTTGRARVTDSLVALATLGPTGIPYVVHGDRSVARIQRRSVVPIADTFPAVPDGIWGGVRDRLIALLSGEGGRRLMTLTPGQDPFTQPVPDGPVAVATWGDVVAVGTDSGLVTVDPTGATAPRFLKLRSPARLVQFSPSAHRVFVLTADQELVAVDRLGMEVLDRLELDGLAAEIRTDPFGRLLLVRPVTGDSLWIVDLARWTVAATLPGAWNENLPQVASDGTLLLRREQRIVVFDYDSLRVVGQTDDAEGDRWLAAAWDPRRPALELAADAEQVAQPPGQLVYVQVSSTSNEAWATDLAANLRRAGMKAAVLPPDELDEPYRVVLGPYPTREEAEQIRGRLQMPSWILLRDTTRTSPP